MLFFGRGGGKKFPLREIIPSSWQYLSADMEITSENQGFRHIRYNGI
jgi:hypothetical protein